MAFTGVRSAGESTLHVAPFFSGATGAVTAGQVLTEWSSCVYGRIGGFSAQAQTAGSGAGNTVLDVQITGTSIYTVTASRPTLASASTGQFTNAKANIRAIRPGDRVTVLVLSIPATTGHARVSGTVAVEDA